MDTATKERMKCKFDICYVMAKEGMAFTKYPALYDLESRHEVDLGVAQVVRMMLAQRPSLTTLLIASVEVLSIRSPTRTSSVF